MPRHRQHTQGAGLRGSRPPARRRLSSAGAHRDRWRRDRPGELPEGRRGGVACRRIGWVVRHDRWLLRDLRRDAPQRRRTRHLRRSRDHLRGRVPPWWRRCRGRWRVPDQRTLDIGQRIEPRQLVRRWLHDPEGRRAGRRSSGTSVDAGVLLPCFGHAGHRYVGFHRPSRHGEPRLCGPRCLRPDGAHDVVPGAACE